MSDESTYEEREREAAERRRQAREALRASLAPDDALGHALIAQAEAQERAWEEVQQNPLVAAVLAGLVPAVTGCSFEARRKRNRGPLEVNAGAGWVDWKDPSLPAWVRAWLDSDDPTHDLPDRAFPPVVVDVP